MSSDNPLVVISNLADQLSAAVWPGDDLEHVPIRVLPVHAAATVVGVELARPPAEGVGPVGQPALLDPPEYVVEIRLIDQKSVVLWAAVGPGCRSGRRPTPACPALGRLCGSAG
jgi:hypothetical protein